MDSYRAGWAPEMMLTGRPPCKTVSGDARAAHPLGSEAQFGSTKCASNFWIDLACPIPLDFVTVTERRLPLWMMATVPRSPLVSTQPE